MLRNVFTRTGSLFCSRASLSTSAVPLGAANSLSSPNHGAYKLKEAPGTEGAANKTFTYFVVASAGMGYAGFVKHEVTSLLGALSPSLDVMAMANMEFDLSDLPEGQAMTVKWRGKPVFIRHRTAAEIAAAEADDSADLRDPETDASRVKNPKYLVLIGICTHLGCVPLNAAGSYNGWFCPCHGSHYDLSGRIRAGPAPRNLEIPAYKYLSDSQILVGEE
eukprot:CAMPEP_0119118292 /NCGR_PEP_ID=MMETSP1310-20130426/192_1 /TAXON_ID=464262 /ORGANISM="Genus nov. species nov., Strain RCC2339" /LENGTH=219 /DNA_ID=CAMNT_0007107639 /DNA_START=151 /DNA_END=810 /DNA_ORIENTATION=-